MRSTILLHCLVKLHSICMRHFYLGLYFSSSRYYCVHGHDLSWNVSSRIILLWICWQYLSQVGSCALPRLDSLCVFVRNWRLYFLLLLRCGFMYWCFMDIILLHWYFWIFLWFWGILTGSATLIRRINECSWWIMFLRMHGNRFIYFYKPTHGLSVAGWNEIYTTSIDSGEGRRKCNMELWWYP